MNCKRPSLSLPNDNPPPCPPVRKEPELCPG